MKKFICGAISLLTLGSMALADVIDPSWPRTNPRPVNVPKPEPEDDGEVVVIKTIIFIVLLAIMVYALYRKSTKVRE